MCYYYLFFSHGNFLNFLFSKNLNSPGQFIPSTKRSRWFSQIFFFFPFQPLIQKEKWTNECTVYSAGPPCPHTERHGVLMIWWWAGGCFPLRLYISSEKPDGLSCTHTEEKGRCANIIGLLLCRLSFRPGDEMNKKKGNRWCSTRPFGDMVITVARAQSTAILPLYSISLRYYDELKLFLFHPLDIMLLQAF